MTDWVFITSADQQIGLGHASRVATLAGAAQRGGDQVQVVVPPGKEVPPLEEVGVSVRSSSFTATELGGIFERASNEAILFLDLPDPLFEPLDWLTTLPNLRVAFRMFGPPVHGAIEHVSLTPEFEEPEDRVNAFEDLPRLAVSGRELIIVRPSLFGQPSDKLKATPAVLVTMGGSDPHGLTERACEDLLVGGFQGHVIVVVGASNSRSELIRERFSHRFEVLAQQDVNFDRLLRTSAVAVISGGLTRYECIAANTPFAAISIHDTQYEITEKVTRHGFGLNVGVHTEIPKGSITEAVNRLLADTNVGNLKVGAVAQWISPSAPEQLLERCRGWQRSVLR